MSSLFLNETGRNLSMIPFFSADLSESEWDKYMNDLDQIMDDDENDRAYAKAYGSILIICESGCLSYEGLILKGELTGQVVSITYEHNYPPLLDSNGSFLNWYEKWLDEIINGSAIFINYMYQKEHDEKYTSQTK